MEKKKSTKAKWIIVIILLVILAFLALIGFITDYLWFKELSYVSVFFTQLFAQLKLGIPTFIIMIALLLVYMKILKKGYYNRIESKEVPDEGKLKLAGWLIAIVGSGFIAPSGNV